MSVPIRDSRTMHGSRPLPDAAAVQAEWVRHGRRMADSGGFLFRPGAKALDQIGGKPQPAYVSDNRWVVDCPRCSGGAAAMPGYPRACCYDCGGIFTVAFPPPRELASGVAALERRPPGNRHWLPSVESAADLAIENAARGVM